MSSLGAIVAVGEQSDQMLELPQPKNGGATKLVEPTPEKGDQGNQPQELREPEVPTSGLDQQVEVDEVQGSEVQTEVFGM